MPLYDIEHCSGMVAIIEAAKLGAWDHPSEASGVKPSPESLAANPSNPFKLDLERALDAASAPRATAVGRWRSAAGPQVADQARAAWNASADVQQEFTTIGSRVAFREAAAAGRIRGYDTDGRQSRQRR